MVIGQGAIVWAHVRDSAGANSKCRPVVIVTPTADISHDSTVIGVAVTSTFTKPLRPREVAIPWRDGVNVGGVCPPNVLAEMGNSAPGIGGSVKSRRKDKDA